MKHMQTVSGFGLIIIGNEILDGRVQDKHFTATRDLLASRNLLLHYAMVLPDDPEVIDSHLAWARARPEPFFCCGGIGSTPDDCTRHCAARVYGRPLELHPEGEALLKSRFGDRATPERLRMVEFPQGADLIPNPVNQVPGFQLESGYFVPGFPEMAAPMMAWVLDSYYQRGAERVQRALVLPGAKEADMVGIMESFIATHPTLSFSSLPRFTETGTEVRLGLAGSPRDVEAGLRDLSAALDAAGVEHLPMD